MSAFEINKITVNHSRSVPPQDRKNRQRDSSAENTAAPNSRRELKKFNRSGLNASSNQGNQTDTDAFRVYVRARPLSIKEQNCPDSERRINIIKKEDNMVKRILTFNKISNRFLYLVQERRRN